MMANTLSLLEHTLRNTLLLRKARREEVHIGDLLPSEILRDIFESIYLPIKRVADRAATHMNRFFRGRIARRRQHIVITNRFADVIMEPGPVNYGFLSLLNRSTDQMTSYETAMGTYRDQRS